MKDTDPLDDRPYTLSPNHNSATAAEAPSPASRIPVATAMGEHPPTLPPASTKPQVTAQSEVSLNMKLYCASQSVRFNRM